MPVIAKPYSITQKLVRSIFRGKPNVFAAEDINRQNEAFLAAMNRLQGFVGEVSFNFIPLVTITTDTVAGNTYSLSFSITYAGGGELYARGVRFTIPAFAVADVIEGNIGPKIPLLFLVAKKRVVTFAEDQVLSGISSDEYPTPVAAADTEIYSDERVVLAYTYAGVVLAGGEEIVSLLGCIDYKPQADGTYKASFTKEAIDQTAFQDAVFPYGGQNKRGYSVMNFLNRIVSRLAVMKAINFSSDNMSLTRTDHDSLFSSLKINLTTRGLATGAELNNLHVEGRYFGQNLLNRPDPANSSWWYVDVMVHDANPASLYLSQLARELTGGNRLYIRNCQAGTWSSWSRLATSTDIAEEDWKLYNENNGGEYRKDNAGWVHFKGMYMNSVGWATVELPVNYRPAVDTYFRVPARVVSGGGTVVFDFITIKAAPSGVLSFSSYTFFEGGGVGDNWYAHINGSFFKGVSV